MKKKKFTRILGVGITIALLTSLMVVATPVSANVSQPLVALSATTLSATANYTVLFDVVKSVSNDGTGYITVAFPVGTTIGTIGTDTVKVQSTAGFGTQNALTDVSANTTKGTDQVTLTINVDLLNNPIGEYASVKVEFLNLITNPNSAGSYTLTAATSEETTAVTSAPYAITTPYVGPLEGIVSVYNPAAVLMGQFTGNGAITAAIAYPVAKDYVVKIGPGTYDAESISTPVGGVTFVATGAASETIIKTNWTINEASITLDSLTLQGTLILSDAGSGANTTAATPIVIKNCVLTNAAAASPPPGLPENLIETTAGYVTIQDSTFDTSYGALEDKAIQVGGGQVTVSGCAFTLDANAAGADDNAVDVTASGAVVTVVNCGISGASGIGYETVAGSTAQIVDTAFDGLETAVYMTGAATLTIRGCAIMNSTNPSPIAYGSAVDINAATSVLIEGCDIEGNAGYSVDVAANASVISIIGNSLSGNAKGMQNKDISAPLMAALNWWGDASGPTIYSNVGGTGDPIASGIGIGTVTYKPWAMALIPDVATGDVPADGTLDKSGTVGIVYTSSVATTGIALARYASNPAALPPPYTALANGYFDVYVAGAGGTNTIKFYAAGVTPNTVAYYWSEIAGAWSACSDQGVAGTGAYVWVRVRSDTLPSNVELGGTPFVLVTVPPSPVVELTSPAIGGYDVAVEPMFTWKVVPVAIRYEIALAEDPTFSIIEWSYNVDGNLYKAEEELRYATTYYWRVRAVTGEPYLVGPTWVTPAGPWATGIFTTKAEPAEAVEPVTEITVETPEVTVTPGEVTVDVAPVVPDYLLWTIVGIGAVLIIALIVLIVRTRRVA